MNCEYVEISVLHNKGIDELLLGVVQKCMELQQYIEDNNLENQRKGTFSLRKEGTKLKPSIENISPVRVKMSRRRGGCCH